MTTDKHFKLALKYLKKGDCFKLKKIVNENSYLKKYADGDNSIIHYAFFIDSYYLLKLLSLDFGLDLDLEDSCGDTVLILACANKNIKVVKALIDAGVNVNHQNHNGETAFSYACVNNSLEVAKLLYGSGANINTFDLGGGTPLDWAAQYSSKKLYDWMVTIGCKHNHCKGWGALPNFFENSV